MSATATTTRDKKVSTIVRLPKSLKAEATRLANENHIDFSTLLTISLQRTVTQGVTIEPMYEVSPKYAKKLQGIIDRFDSGKEKGAGPFEGQAAIDYLKTLY